MAIDEGFVDRETSRTNPKTSQPARVAPRPFTLVLATDRPGQILNGVIQRRVRPIILTHYEVAELKEIVVLYRPPRRRSW